MDRRITFQNFRELQELLLGLTDTNVSLLVDEGGLTRMETKITRIDAADDPRKSILVLGNGATLLLEQVIAVNGTFRWDYTEC